MKNKTVRSLALLVAVVGMAVNVHAIPIPPGTIQMSGTVALDNTLALANNVTAFGGVFVSVPPSGAYVTVPVGTPVTWRPFGWNPATTPVSPLWTMLAGNYTFTLNTIRLVTQTSTSLILTGTGVATILGFDPTGAAWTFTIPNSTTTPPAKSTGGASFTSQITIIPDGGVTAMLLGSALSVLGLIRRKLA